MSTVLTVKMKIKKKGPGMIYVLKNNVSMLP